MIVVQHRLGAAARHRAREEGRARGESGGQVPPLDRRAWGPIAEQDLIGRGGPVLRIVEAHAAGDAGFDRAVGRERIVARQAAHPARRLPPNEARARVREPGAFDVQAGATHCPPLSEAVRSRAGSTAGGRSERNVTAGRPVLRRLDDEWSRARRNAAWDGTRVSTRPGAPIPATLLERHGSPSYRRRRGRDRCVAMTVAPRRSVARREDGAGKRPLEHGRPDGGVSRDRGCERGHGDGAREGIEGHGQTRLVGSRVGDPERHPALWRLASQVAGHGDGRGQERGAPPGNHRVVGERGVVGGRPDAAGRTTFESRTEVRSRIIPPSRAPRSRWAWETRGRASARSRRCMDQPGRGES